MKSFFSAIKRNLDGKGSFEELILFWWIFLNIASLLIGIVVALFTANYFRGMSAELNQPYLDYFVALIGFITAMLGYIILFIYPFILLGSLWALSKNIKRPLFLWLFTFLIIIPVQIVFSMLYWLGSTLILFDYIEI